MRYEVAKAISDALRATSAEVSTVAEVEHVVGLLEQLGDYDDEESHSYEDKLHQAVLRAVARGAEFSQPMAAAALKTLDIKFARWCA